MKLTKKLEAEIKGLMDTYWNSYFSGDIEHWASYLVDDYRNIGGTEEEIWNSRQEILDYTHRVIDQMKGVSEIRNKQIQIIPYDPYFMVHELMDIYIKIENEWAFYQKFRLSSLIQKQPGEWKVLHQHGSYPDSKTQEGEAFAFDALRNENLKLQQAIKTRTAELEDKARALEIEASLEKVRAEAMGIKKPDDILAICKVMFTELQSLGFSELRNTLINFWDDDSYSLIDYDYSTETGGHKAKLSLSSHPVFEQFQKQIKNSQNAFAELIVTKNELESWRQRRRDSGEYEDVRLNDIEALYYYFYSIGVGAIGISTFNSITEEKLSVLKRFRNVFDFAYRRYADVAHAEAQAREAQIEVAVERVRAKSLSMHQSEDLHGVVVTLKKELLGLNIHGVSAVTMYLGQDDGSIRGIDLSGMTDGEEEGSAFRMDKVFRLEDTDPALWIRKIWNGKEKYFVIEADEADFDRIIEWLYTLDEKEAAIAEKIIKEERITKAWLATVSLERGKLSIDLLEPPTPEIESILVKVGAAFDLAYTRFLDLQKAEAQVREGKIELALERVRAKAMAMQGPTDFVDVINVMGEQFIHLDFDIEWANFGANGLDISNGIDAWNFAVIQGSNPISNRLFIPYFDHSIFVEGVEQLDKYRRTGNDLFELTCGKEEKDRWLDHLFATTIFKDIPAELKAMQYAKPGYTSSTIILKDTWLSIGKFDKQSFTDEQHAILRRFGKAFGQAYTRFLDLQKAEAQAREAKIEAALERVRSRTMAMQRSEELGEVASVLFHQMNQLVVNLWTCGFVLCENNRDEDEWWLSMDGDFTRGFALPNVGDYAHATLYEGWLKGDAIRAVQLDGEALQEHYDWLMQIPVSRAIFEEMDAAGLARPEWQKLHAAYFSKGYLVLITREPCGEEEVFKRFAQVFDLIYTRFLDLQKAEAQAKEAQVELSLERIRAQALAMRVPADLLDIVVTMRREFVALGHEAHYFWHMRWQPDKYEKAMTSGDGTRIGMVMELPRHMHGDIPLLADWENSNEPTVIYAMDAEMAVDYVDKMVSLGDFKQLDPNAPSHDDIRHIGGLTFIMARTTHGEIGFSLPGVKRDVPNDDLATLVRFASAFDLAYKRFEDLKSTEQRNRESQIELALERVRAHTMAMQNSNELPEAANKLFIQVQALGIPAWSCGYNILSPDKKSSTCIMSSEGELQVPFTLPLTEHKSFLPWFEAIQNNEELFVYQQGGEELADHYSYMKSLPELKSVFKQFENAGLALPTFQVNHLALFKEGFLLFITYEDVPDAHEVFKRFAKVFEQTYTRFLDLQKAEFQARQAKIETALEKVRARALAMQLPEELIEVAEVLRHEMGLLGVEELETCSIYIHDKTIDRTECWYALKDIRAEEKKLVSDHFPLHLSDTWVGREMDKFYGTQAKQVSILMQGAHRKEWINYCEEKSIPFRGYYGAVIPDRTYHLYKFSHGAIGAASAGNISTESWDLLQRAASVFSLAYSRFKDLTQARVDLEKLKTEKLRAEDALTNLKAAQSQLVQSEKMASLGELTAGIAHEIQNPLNFVNNFSELSKELLDEMREAINKGDADEAKEIMNDVIQNLEKINHHGKRADGIVKGMLQHSRSNSGQSEPTSINALADEYLRLAYHGLRAKDKSFNVTMETDFDESIGKINIIPQDIGRVILNLITNAFYVVAEKKKMSGKAFEPTVSLTTRKAGGSVELSVRDNGDGIPPHVLDKIFQPFFTTKPTGQGTGLGLSLSYDIVKAHGGELKVETKGGEGSTFIIQLPVV